MISLRCKNCAKDLKVKDELAGKRVRCPGCGQIVAVPGLDGATQSDQKKSIAPSFADEATLAPEQGSRAEVDATHAGTAVADSGLWDFLAPATLPDEIGRLGTYRVLKVLGAGGMGVVFRAEDPQLERIVALKAMLPELARKAEAKQRFFREAKAAAALKHPNIVTIHQVGEDRGAPFLAMEFLEGEPLDVRLKRETRLSVPETLRIGREIARGLAAAHEKGLIHRDIKPANIWLETGAGEPRASATGGHVKILDFGLARAMGDQTQLTQSGAIIGTPAYMAPEQASGKGVDHRSDLFSLGCVLYRMATGELPFQGSDTISILSALALETPSPPLERNPEIPAELSDLVMKLLEKKPAQRIASAKEVAELLANLELDFDATQEISAPRTKSRSMKRAATMSAGKNPSQATTGGTAPARKSRKALLAGIAGVLIAAAVAAVFLLLPAPSGTARIEIDDPAIQVAVDQGEFKIQGAGKHEVTLPVGEHLLKVKRGDLALSPEKFSLKKGETVTLKIEWFKEGKLQVMQGDKVIGSLNASSHPGHFALEFSGKGDWVDIPSLSSPAPQPVTVEAWVTPLRADANTVVVFLGGKIAFSIHDIAGQWNSNRVLGPEQEVVPGPKIAPGVRVHLAVVWDGFRQQFFVAGKKMGNVQMFPIGPVPAQGMHLGAPRSIKDAPFDLTFSGKIAGVRISKVARYNADFTPAYRFQPDEGTLALYRFDEGTGDVLKDSSGNGHHGKIVGTKWFKLEPPSTAEEIAAAEWVLSKKGFVTIRQEGNDQVVNVTKLGTTIDKLPTSPFRIVGVNLSPSNAETQQVNDLDLRQFACFKQLETLDLGGQPGITTAGLAHLSGNSDLKALRIYSSGIGPDAIPMVSKFNRLEKFMFPGGDSDKWAEALAKLPRMREVTAYRCDLSDAGVGHLARMQNLEILSIDDCGDVTDASVKALMGCRSLRKFLIGNTKITRGEAEKLAQALPECEVTFLENGDFKKLPNTK